jgi:CheY-like chemotaxis protein
MASQRAPIGEAVRGEIPTVLVVEDDYIVCMAIAEHLHSCGYCVLEAGNADDAIAVLKADARIGARINVVFSDVQMPGSMDGFGLAGWVRRERPGTKIILTSGVSCALEAANDLCDGGPLLDKPYNPAEVVRRIRTLLAA